MSASDVLTLTGLVAIAVGLALVFLPLGVIAVGAEALLLGLGLRSRR